MATQTSLFFMVCLARGHQDLEAMVAGPNRSRFINISLAIGFLSHPLVASAPEKISKRAYACYRESIWARNIDTLGHLGGAFW